MIRYGIDAGSFTTDEGEPYEMLSLPYLKESMPYHEYNVLNECAVLCYVDKGVTAPGFNSKGGAVQYRHYYSLKDSIKLGILEEDLGWLETKKKI